MININSCYYNIKIVDKYFALQMTNVLSNNMSITHGSITNITIHNQCTGIKIETFNVTISMTYNKYFELFKTDNAAVEIMYYPFQ